MPTKNQKKPKIQQKHTNIYIMTHTKIKKHQNKTKTSNHKKYQQIKIYNNTTNKHKITKKTQKCKKCKGYPNITIKRYIQNNKKKRYQNAKDT